jgi:hypothetical protein
VHPALAQQHGGILESHGDTTGFINDSVVPDLNLSQLAASGVVSELLLGVLPTEGVPDFAPELPLDFVTRLYRLAPQIMPHPDFVIQVSVVAIVIMQHPHDKQPVTIRIHQAVTDSDILDSYPLYLALDSADFVLAPCVRSDSPEVYFVHRNPLIFHLPRAIRPGEHMAIISSR